MLSIKALSIFAQYMLNSFSRVSEEQPVPKSDRFFCEPCTHIKGFLAVFGKYLFFSSRLGLGIEHRGDDLGIILKLAGIKA